MEAQREDKQMAGMEERQEAKGRSRGGPTVWGPTGAKAPVRCRSVKLRLVDRADLIDIANVKARRKVRPGEHPVTVCAKQVESSTRRAIALGLNDKSVLAGVENIEGIDILPPIYYSIIVRVQNCK